LTESQPHDAATDLLIKEVDTELRQERMARLWRRHGPLLAGAGIVLILGVAGWQGWRAWDGQRRQEASRDFTAIAASLDQGKRDEAIAELARLSGAAPTGYRLLATMRLADLRQQQGDTAAAAALYQGLAKDQAIDSAYREMATIRLGYLTLDSANPAELTRQIEPLAAEASPWRHSAREILGLLALRQGDQARAIEWFGRIAEDAAAPEGLRSRAAEMRAAATPAAGQG